LKAGDLTVAVPADLHGLSSEDVLAIQAVIVKYGFLIDDRAMAGSPTSPTAMSWSARRPGGASRTSPSAATAREGQ
jgi:hypothetical protein